MKNQPIVILGAGISGLSTAAFLAMKGEKVLVLEANDRVGGVISTEKKDGYIYDFATNSAIEKNFEIRDLIAWLGFEDQLLQSSSESSKRYILKDNRLNALKGPLSFIFTKLISWPGKFRILKEFWIPKKSTDKDETMSSFVSRRFGHELLDYALNPLVAGVYAGCPEDISMKAAYSNMFDMEQNHGSVIGGSIAFLKEKRKSTEPRPSKAILSMKEGMQSLPEAISQKLGDQIVLSATVDSITKDELGYEISYVQNGETKRVKAEKVISTVPAHRSCDLVKELSPVLSKSLANIYYPPVAVLNIAYDKSSIGQALDSYGYLVPAKEEKKYLGAIWSSTIYKNRAPKDKALFTLMIGGSRVKNLLDLDLDSYIDEAISEFETVLKISGKPTLKTYKLWKKAIPQYNIGHPEIMKDVADFEKENPGFFISGNYRGGNGVADCIGNGKKYADLVVG